jgi:hypothetical protein
MKKSKAKAAPKIPTTPIYMGVIVAGTALGALSHTDFLHGVALGIVIGGAVAMGWSIAAQA